MSALAREVLAPTHNIKLWWDDHGKLTITDLPQTVSVGDSVHFSSPQGPVTITFVSPFGDPTVTLTENNVMKLVKGGIYHFLCAVNGNPPADEGGVIDIVPHK